MSFDEVMKTNEQWVKTSQSLSNRAMSFDLSSLLFLMVHLCLNPFRTGRCLSTFERNQMAVKRAESLNPFRTGRCLSTNRVRRATEIGIIVSIPFEQGDVFRQMQMCKMLKQRVSIPFEQGDVFRHVAKFTKQVVNGVSIPFEQGDVFRHLL